MKEKKLREILKHNKLNRLKTFAEETTMCLDLKLSSIQRYIDAIGGQLQIAVALPSGKSVIYKL
ncbi:hypothetical protein [Actinobacillus pleuropneumoniae]|uniref:hypothetical protein n=1 Tax=Actinobacillus pleuropneumoniae TaxID=715 RepID=UPI0001E492FE|nr:hypothetical protein [Actinobacillus pleuropneumoniae]EFM93638.1 Predicted transcriptional regulator [Actinobacillus pleuropneumoniae serovar 9 str. CVJ13261]UKH35456.1 hypothetical protein D1102_08215 [Actinobacillus pleuropneumoniae serovar 9 str. CVJ13261]